MGIQKRKMLNLKTNFKFRRHISSFKKQTFFPKKYKIIPYLKGRFSILKQKNYRLNKTTAN
jgi:hypothetical protein